MTLRFHWRLPQGGELAGSSRASTMSQRAGGLPALDAQTEFAQAAEAHGVDSLLVNFGVNTADPILLSTAIGMCTRRIRFLIAWRSGLMSPTMFVQQINTLSALIDGRVSLNIVAGHSPAEQRSYGDFLAHDQRYERTEEFLAVTRAMWQSEEPVDFAGTHYTVEKARVNTPFVSPFEDHPEIYVAGNSPPARAVALTQGDCWMMMIEPPHMLRGKIDDVLSAGKSVGIRAAVIVRPTRRAALEVAEALVAGAGASGEMEKKFVRNSDSTSFRNRFEMAKDEWLTPVLWAGAVRTHGPAATALVGNPDEVAAAIDEYVELGVTQFILSGWPKLEEMTYFSEEVVPRVTAMRTAACV